MARNFRNPYTGATQDFDSIPVFSHTRQQMGRFCPTTGNPLDEEAFRNFTYAFGNEESNAMLRRDHLQKINAVCAELGLPEVTLIEASPVSDAVRAAIREEMGTASATVTAKSKKR